MTVLHSVAVLIQLRSKNSAVTQLPLHFQLYWRRNGAATHLPSHFAYAGSKTKEVKKSSVKPVA